MKLVTIKEMCCGCSACANICPKQAVHMEEDNLGFIYPSINEDKCINCNLCVKACAYKYQTEVSNPVGVYVASTNNTNILQSASGGVFASLATSVINDGGIVFGASLETQGRKLVPKHIYIDNILDLYKLQGSKYVQSHIGNVYKEAKVFLDKGRLVLFSGTPCQVAGLKGFLRKEYDNLLLVDIICHGVPSEKFFSDYLHYEEERIKGRIVDIKFRDKSYGWDLCGRADYIDKKGRKKTVKILPAMSSYYNLFLGGHIYRDSCYSCKYASSNRPGDITIGDYWGIEREHPEILQEKNNGFEAEKGISCIVINNTKGKGYIEKYKSGMNLRISTYSKVIKKNAQLKYPSQKSIVRDTIFELYEKEGYEAVAKWFIREQDIRYYVKKIFYLLPLSIRKKIKNLCK